MTRCMEARVFDDGDKVAAFSGKDFKSSALPKRMVLDDEPKESLSAAIYKATKDDDASSTHTGNSP
jgi:hypothetical protein